MQSLIMIRGFLFIFLISIFFTSCDYVKNAKTNIGPINVGSNYVSRNNLSKIRFQKVLIEDYTGHTCGNCPKAAAKAEALMSQYGDTVVMLGVHVGYYAEPSLPTYPADYRTPAGTDWDNFFGVSSSGLPKGMISRVNYPASNILSYTQWSSAILPLIHVPVKATLKVFTDYDTTHRILNVKNTAIFNSSFGNDLYICNVVAEDSIVGKQKDYSQSPDEVDNYTFHYMLRGAINGSWGNVLKSAPINVNDSTTKNFNGFSVSGSFNDKRLYVISFVYDNSTKQVIQCEKVKIR